MRIVDKNPLLYEKEQKEKERRLLDEQQAREYLDKMRDNKYFRRFIIDGIIRKNINELGDITRIPNSANAEEMGKLVIQAKMAKIQLEKILSELIN